MPKLAVVAIPSERDEMIRREVEIILVRSQSFHQLFVKRSCVDAILLSELEIEQVTMNDRYDVLYAEEHDIRKLVEGLKSIFRDLEAARPEDQPYF